MAKRATYQSILLCAGASMEAARSVLLKVAQCRGLDGDARLECLKVRDMLQDALALSYQKLPNKEPKA